MGGKEKKSKEVEETLEDEEKLRRDERGYL